MNTFSANTLPIQTLSSEAKLPTRAYAGDAGLDLYASESVEIPAGEGRKVRTGVAIALPEKSVGLIADRSSMAAKGLKTAGGVIDAGYRGEIQVILWNLSKTPFGVTKGDKVAQLLILPILTPMPEGVEVLPVTERGAQGFGSSGS